MSHIPNLDPAKLYPNRFVSMNIDWDVWNEPQKVMRDEEGRELIVAENPCKIYWTDEEGERWCMELK